MVEISKRQLEFLFMEQMRNEKWIEKEKKFASAVLGSMLLSIPAVVSEAYVLACHSGAFEKIAEYFGYHT